ncbi:hypothetical protein Ms3S1_35270 [Methylosinus sp. 3S-1]
MESEAALARFRNGKMMNQKATAPGQSLSGDAQSIFVYTFWVTQTSRALAYFYGLDFYVGSFQSWQTPSGRRLAAKWPGR